MPYTEKPDILKQEAHKSVDRSRQIIIIISGRRETIAPRILDPALLFRTTHTRAPWRSFSALDSRRERARRRTAICEESGPANLSLSVHLATPARNVAVPRRVDPSHGVLASARWITTLLRNARRRARRDANSLKAQTPQGAPRSRSPPEEARFTARSFTRDCGYGCGTATVALRSLPL